MKIKLENILKESVEKECYDELRQYLVSLYNDDKDCFYNELINLESDKNYHIIKKELKTFIKPFYIFEFAFLKRKSDKECFIVNYDLKSKSIVSCEDIESIVGLQNVECDLKEEDIKVLIENGINSKKCFVTIDSKNSIFVRMEESSKDDVKKGFFQKQLNKLVDTVNYAMANVTPNQIRIAVAVTSIGMSMFCGSNSFASDSLDYLSDVKKYMGNDVFEAQSILKSVVDAVKNTMGDQDVHIATAQKTLTQDGHVSLMKLSVAFGDNDGGICQIDMSGSHKNGHDLIKFDISHNTMGADCKKAAANAVKAMNQMFSKIKRD